MNDFYYLAHGGPGSGRYPLGSGDRPYQKFEESRKKHSSLSGYISSKKLEKKKSMEIRKKQEQEKLLENKERVLKSGKASEVLRYKGQLTTKELQDVYKRLNLEKQLSEMSATEVIDNEKVISRVLSNIEKTTSWVVKGAISYNTLANIYNGLVGPSKSLPTIKILK